MFDCFWVFEHGGFCGGLVVCGYSVSVILNFYLCDGFYLVLLVGCNVVLL